MAWAFAVLNCSSFSLFGDALVRRWEAALGTDAVDTNTSNDSAMISRTDTGNSTATSSNSTHSAEWATVYNMKCLHQLVLWHRELNLTLPFSQALRERCSAVFHAAAAKKPPAQYRSEIMPSLQKLGVKILEPDVVQDGYQMDARVRWNDEHIGVMIEGPEGYVMGDDGDNEGYSPNGETLLKHRQLRAAGWRLVVIPEYEWEEHRSTDQDKMIYLDECERESRSRALESDDEEQEDANESRTVEPAEDVNETRTSKPAEDVNESRNLETAGGDIEGYESPILGSEDSDLAETIPDIPNVSLCGLLAGSGVASILLYLRTGTAAMREVPLLAI
eukprot:gnl/TRDRNA2_/TRDRNA2_87727_c0_seq2.p1 gnl/TRDRNA2_/TRDRNA2_87727_c0~~gnl/TRDRNA2_/TRDRNA2_87727_c0_seq2.p1  ORF type:complete len:333 (+),score=63.78 gnl/TRDRNA2_/TRDRNA2_87727_c0_seq2:2-1000(+)